MCECSDITVVKASRKKKENIFDVATICSPVCTEREFGE